MAPLAKRPIQPAAYRLAPPPVPTSASYVALRGRQAQSPHRAPESRMRLEYPRAPTSPSRGASRRARTASFPLTRTLQASAAAFAAPPLSTASVRMRPAPHNRPDPPSARAFARRCCPSPLAAVAAAPRQSSPIAPHPSRLCRSVCVAWLQAHEFWETCGTPSPLTGKRVVLVAPAGQPAPCHHLTTRPASNQPRRLASPSGKRTELAIATRPGW
jgi:hypothetical protein